MVSGIAYYSELVDEMKDDHRALLAIYGDLVQAVHACNESRFISLLQ